jgi:hypothetical protein
LNVTKAFNDYARPDYGRMVKQAAAVAREMAVQVTPSFLIGPTNGRLQAFAPSIDDLQAFTSNIERVREGKPIIASSPTHSLGCTADGAPTCSQR